MWTTKADEGMWLPYLIGKNIQDMQNKGFRLTAEDVYSANHSSLKDAIVQFGGGCTAELISSQGLLLTNHHCGYGNIADLSTVENNYLEDGFWAKSLSEEIPAPGLTVKFLVSMEDVTDFVLPKKAYKSQEEKEKAMEPVIDKITKDASGGGKYVAQVRSFFNGNQYFLFVYQIYTDVRLVATPPNALGKYGGDTDNWMWPRHTADFSIFRIYADKNNQPAPYNPDNVPFKPKHYLPVSIKGVKESDYTMIMGYPGRTNRYATSYELDMAINEVNPSIVKVREEKLAIMRKYMNEDEAVKLKLASKYAQIANYWKYFIGQTEQLKKQRVIAKKQKEEKEYIQWVASQGMNTNLMKEFEGSINQYKPYAKSVVYLSEAFYGSTLSRLGALAKQLETTLSNKKTDQAALDKQIASLKQIRQSLMEDFVYDVEKETFAAMTEMIYQDLPKNQLPDVYEKVIFPVYGKNSEQTYHKYANYVFKNTFLLDEVKFEKFCAHPSLNELKADPAVIYASSFVNNFEQNIQSRLNTYNSEKADLSHEYTAGLLKRNKGKLMYPDANSTMRVTYGSVKSYKPQDAVFYDYKTYMDGLLAKYQPGDLEFDLPQDFINLAESGDFGRYADETGNMPVNFISNNDITGGNSGSPVINGKGELVGLAFDGNWEAMSGDISFDQEFKRTICVDTRFILWLIEKYGKANNLIKEMDIRH
ncbi:MAG: S46 family peptidase [Taibaiella sp.]|nr:S46 family peptidase [Taibaiella sp.]